MICVDPRGSVKIQTLAAEEEAISRSIIEERIAVRGSWPNAADASEMEKESRTETAERGKLQPAAAEDILRSAYRVDK